MGIITVAGILSPDRHVMANVRLVEIEQRRLFVIPVDQKQRRGLGDQSKERTLEGIAIGNRVRIDRSQCVHAEIVAHADIEIGMPGCRVEQCAGIQFRVVHLGTFRVGIALNAKREGAAGGSLRLEAALRPRPECLLTRLAVVQPVEVFERLAEGCQSSVPPACPRGG